MRSFRLARERLSELSETESDEAKWGASSLTESSMDIYKHTLHATGHDSALI